MHNPVTSPGIRKEENMKKIEIPQRATVIACHVRKAGNDFKRPGAEISLKVWENMESMGYKTDFTHVKVHYLAIYENGRLCGVRRVSGRNIEKYAKNEIKYFYDHTLPA